MVALPAFPLGGRKDSPAGRDLKSALNCEVADVGGKSYRIGTEFSRSHKFSSAFFPDTNHFLCPNALNTRHIDANLFFPEAAVIQKL